MAVGQEAQYKTTKDYYKEVSNMLDLHGGKELLLNAPLNPVEPM